MRVVDPLTYQVEAPVDLQDLHVGVLRISLANVMVTHGRSLTAHGKSEWLSVGARDIHGLSGRDGTIRFHILGHDLAALRDGQLTAEEALTRIDAARF